MMIFFSYVTLSTECWKKDRVESSVSLFENFETDSSRSFELDVHHYSRLLTPSF